MAACSTGLLHGQQTKFGNLSVVQNDSGNATTSVTVTLAPGSTGGIALRASSNRGDFDVNMAAGSDREAGALITSVSQLSRDNTAQGDTIGSFFATSAVDFNGNPLDYFIPVHSSPAGGEANINVSMAFFPYTQWIAGLLRNTNGANGGASVPMDQFFGSAGLTLGTHVTTATPGTNNGQFIVNINGFQLGSYTAPAQASQAGILLVNGARNEDNYALSRANADGSFNIFVKDNGANGNSYEQDPFVFAYIPTTAVGTRNLVAMGRVNGDASTDVGAGSFTVTKGPAGIWYLSITGQDNTTGTLIISPEGGASNNVDNIVSFEWDAPNNRWIIESRDLPGPTLQDMANAAEDAFSFAFFKAPPATYIASSFTGNTNDPIADADLGTSGDQPAVLGVNAFPSLTEAFTVAGPLAPLFLNGGSYTEPLNLTDEFGLTVTGNDTAQTVELGSLAGLAGSFFTIRGASEVTVGADNTSTLMEGPLTGGASSSFTKTGTGTLTLTANNPFFGTFTVNSGAVLLDDFGLGGDLSASQIIVNNGGTFTFGATGNTDMPDSTGVVLNPGGLFELGQGENYGVVTLNGGEFRFFSTGRTGVNNSAVAPVANGVAYDVRSGSFTTNFTTPGLGGNLGTANVAGVFAKTTPGTVTMGDGTAFTTNLAVEVNEGTLAFNGAHTIDGTAPFSVGTETMPASLRVDSGITSLNRTLSIGNAGATIETDAAGSFQLRSNTAGTGSLTVSGTGLFDFNPSADQEIPNPIIGSGTIGKIGSANTLLSADSPFSGLIKIDDGPLELGGSIDGSITVGDFGTLLGQGSIGGNLALGELNGGRILLDASTPGVITVDGEVSLIGTTLVDLSTMPAATGNTSLPVFSYGNLTGFGPTALELENGFLYRPGSGVFTDDTANSQVTMSVITKDLIWIGTTGQWDAANTEDWGNSGAEKFYFGDAVTFNDSATNPLVTLFGDLLTGPITVDSDTTDFTIVGGALDYLRGPASLTKRGTSTLAIDAPNTFTGGTTISAGTIEIRQAGSLGTGPVTLGDVATGTASTALYLDANRINFSRPVIISAQGSGTTTLGSRDTVTGSGDNNQFTSITLNRDVVLDSNATDRTDYENISGTGNITVTGTGRSVFPTTPAAFAGNIRVSTTGPDGNLQIGVASTAGDRIPDNSEVTVDAGAILRVSTTAETIGSLAGSGNVLAFSPNGGTATLTIGANNLTTGFSGTLEGSTANNVLALVKTGTATQILSGDNSYSGTTSIQSGTLQIGNGGTTGKLGSGAVTLATGSTLSYQRTGAFTQDGALNSSATPGTNDLIIGGDSTTRLTLAAGGNFNGNITIQQGTLVLGVTNPFGTAANAPVIDLAPGTTLTNGTTSTHAHFGNVRLAGGAVITTTDGIANYNGENYQLLGDLTVSGGNTAAAITRGAARTNTDSGLSLRGTRTFAIDDVTGTIAADLVVSTELEPSDNNTGINEGALIKTGTGTLQLAGNITHSYTGPTTISEGTLIADGSITGTLAIATPATLAPGASAGSFATGSTTIDGTYQCEIDGASADALNITGDLTIGTASTLQLSALPGGFTQPSYAIATWTGTLNGTFANVTGLPANYQLVHDTENRVIEIRRSTDPFGSWKTANGIASASPTDDSDTDGIPNAIEFVLGSDPSGPDSDSSDSLPTGEIEGTFFKFVFTRTLASASFAPYVEFGDSLNDWTTAINGESGIQISEEPVEGMDMDRVTVLIPLALATENRLFARLGVTIP